MTLLHSGVTHLATSNVRDFQNLGFEKVWNPFLGDSVESIAPSYGSGA
jgi:hypothetical protein